MWVLILLIASTSIDWRGDKPIQTEKIEGFTSQDSCIDEGNRLLKLKPLNEYTIYYTACVEVK